MSVVKADSPAADRPAPAATKEAQPIAEEPRRFKARYNAWGDRLGTDQSTDGSSLGRCEMSYQIE